MDENACEFPYCCHTICNTSGRLDINLIKLETCEHLIISEHKFRLRQNTQRFHNFIRNNYPNKFAEDFIQKQIIISHGVKSPVSDLELSLYRKKLSTFTHLPHIREKAFFLKNNIMVKGVPVNTIAPESMKLHVYNQKHCDRLYSCTLGDWLNKANEQNKLLVVLSGSIT